MVCTTRSAYCVVPNIDISLQSGRFWATSIASFSLRERFLDSRTCWIVFIHVVRRRPGGLLEFCKCKSHKILASFSSGICTVWPNREKCHARKIAERCGYPVVSLTSAFHIMVVTTISVAVCSQRLSKNLLNFSLPVFAFSVISLSAKIWLLHDLPGLNPAYSCCKYVSTLLLNRLSTMFANTLLIVVWWPTSCFSLTGHLLSEIIIVPFLHSVGNSLFCHNVFQQIRLAWCSQLCMLQ